MPWSLETVPQFPLERSLRQFGRVPPVVWFPRKPPEVSFLRRSFRVTNCQDNSSGRLSRERFSKVEQRGALVKRVDLRDGASWRLVDYNYEALGVVRASEGRKETAKKVAVMVPGGARNSSWAKHPLEGQSTEGGNSIREEKFRQRGSKPGMSNPPHFLMRSFKDFTFWLWKIPHTIYFAVF